MKRYNYTFFSVLLFLFIPFLSSAQFEEDKSYYIINEATNGYLAIRKDSLRAGSLLVQTHKDSLKSIKWKLEHNADGTYFLYNEFSKKYAFVYKGTMKQGAVVMQASKPNHRSYIWKIIREKSESNSFKIRNRNSNRPIGPYNGRTATGVNIIQDEDRNQKHLYWIFKEVD